MEKESQDEHDNASHERSKVLMVLWRILKSQAFIELNTYILLTLTNLIEPGQMLKMFYHPLQMGLPNGLVHRSLFSLFPPTLQMAKLQCNHEFVSSFQNKFTPDLY